MNRTILVLTTLTLAPGGLVAQVFRDAVLTRLQAGQMVRARTVDGRRIEARLSAIDRDPLTLRLLGHEAPLPVASIDSLWVRGRATKTGAIVGALAGVPLVAIYAGVSCTSDVLVYHGFCAAGPIILAGLAGAAGGALIGTAVGAAIPKWRLAYVLPHRSSTSRFAAPRSVGFVLSIRLQSI